MRRFNERDCNPKCLPQSVMPCVTKKLQPNEMQTLTTGYHITSKQDSEVVFFRSLLADNLISDSQGKQSVTCLVLSILVAVL